MLTRARLYTTDGNWGHQQRLPPGEGGKNQQEDARIVIAHTGGLVTAEDQGFRGKVAPSCECVLFWEAHLALPLDLRQKLNICLLDSHGFPG